MQATGHHRGLTRRAGLVLGLAAMACCPAEAAIPVSTATI